MAQRNKTAVPDAPFMASAATWQEKSSDMNVASHLLVGVIAGNATSRQDDSPADRTQTTWIRTMSAWSVLLWPAKETMLITTPPYNGRTVRGR
jgi:hypothetical protein